MVAKLNIPEVKWIRNSKEKFKLLRSACNTSVFISQPTRKGIQLGFFCTTNVYYLPEEHICKTHWYVC